MIKKELSVIDFDSYGEEIELTITVRFLYSLRAIRLYEQRTGRNFFDDNQKAIKSYTVAVAQAGFGNKKELTEEEQLELLPLLMNSDFLTFLMDAIPCLYGEVSNGKFEQNELTMENADFSLWIGELISIQFYTELIVELNRSRLKVPQDRKKPQ